MLDEQVPLVAADHDSEDFVSVHSDSADSQAEDDQPSEIVLNDNAPAVPAPAVNMPVKREDQYKVDQSKVKILTEFRRYEKHKAGANPNVRGISGPLGIITRELDELERTVMRIISGLTEGPEQDAYMDEWITYSDIQQNALTTAYVYHDSLDGAIVAADPNVSIINAAKKRLDAHVQQILDDIEDCSNLLATDTEEDDNGQPKILSKLQARVYSKRLADIKLMISPGMAENLEALCKKDINNADQHHTDNPAKVKEVMVPYNKLMADYAAKNFADDCDDLNASVGPPPSVAAASSISAFAPPSHSTHVSACSGSLRPRYNDQEKLPLFKGDYAEYPLWRKEWNNSVMIGRDEAWIKRNLAASVQVKSHPELSTRIKLAKSPAKAFDILDQVFANSLIISQEVISAFTSLRPTDLDNFTPQAQVVALDTKLETLRQQLEAVEEDYQLKQTGQLLFHAIDLLPRIYKGEFNNLRQKAEREAKRNKVKYSGEDLFALLQEFLEDKTAQFREYEPETLRKKSRNDPPEKKNNSRGSGKNNSEGSIQANQRTASDETETQSSPPPGSKPKGDSSSSVLEGLPQERQDVIKKIWAKNGKCPICSSNHTWKGEKGVMASDQVGDCYTFRKMKVDDRIKKYKSLKLCRRCLAWTHTVDQCTRDTTKTFCKKKDDSGALKCKKDHATLLCGGSIALNYIQAPELGPKVDVMLAIISFPISSTVNVVTLLDGGSTHSLVTHEFAKQCGLRGTWRNQMVELAGQRPHLQRVAYYKLTVVHPERAWDMMLVGLDRISTSPGQFSVEAAYDLFPHIERGALEKPAGDIQMLIGADQIAMIPGGGEGENLVQNLRVFDIPVAPFKVLMGSHPDISFLNPTLSDISLQYRSAVFTPLEQPSLCVNYWDSS